MKNTALLKPLLVHVIISILAGLTLIIISSFDMLMINTFVRNSIYLFETVVAIFLYLSLSRKYLKKLPSKTLLSSVAIILTINLVLGFTGYLMMHLGSGIMAENGQLPLIILTVFNFGISPLVTLFTLPEFLNIILLSLASPVLLYLGSRKLAAIKE